MKLTDADLKKIQDAIFNPLEENDAPEEIIEEEFKDNQSLSNEEFLQEENRFEKVEISDEEVKALEAERRLEEEMNMFFQNNPTASQDYPSETIDITEEDVEVTISDDGEVIAESDPASGEPLKGEVSIEDYVAPSSFLEEEVTVYVMESHLQEMNNYRRRMIAAFDEASRGSNLHSSFVEELLENFERDESFSRDKEEVQLALSSENVSFDAIQNSVLKEKLKRDTRNLIKSTFNLVKEFEKE